MEKMSVEGIQFKKILAEQSKTGKVAWQVKINSEDSIYPLNIAQAAKKQGIMNEILSIYDYKEDKRFGSFGPTKEEALALCLRGDLANRDDKGLNLKGELVLDGNPYADSYEK